MIYYIYSDIASTQDTALQYVRSYGIPCECVAFRALIQSEGYGRRGSVWKSALGNLALSILLPLTPSARYRDQLAVYSAEVIQSILEIYGVRTTLKPPNDILWDGKKVSGILAHIVQETPKSWCAAVGIGMNVNDTPVLSDAEYRAVSLSDILGHSIDVEQLTQFMLGHFQTLDQHYG
jgi:BirA family biotin operon repressor/biotin-[acetyl-CoA-carboxylase] ligase